MKTKTSRSSDMKEKNGPSVERRKVPALPMLKPWIHSVSPTLRRGSGTRVSILARKPRTISV